MLNHHFPNETLLKNWSRPHSWTHPEYHISGDIPIISHYIPRKTSQPKIINLPILRADLPLAQTWVMSLFRWAAFESRGPKGWEILRIQSRMTNNMTKNMSIQIKQASWRFFFHGKKKKTILGDGSMGVDPSTPQLRPHRKRGLCRSQGPWWAHGQCHIDASVVPMSPNMKPWQ